MSFIAELRRRNVFKAGIAYVLVAWLILQAGDVLGPALRLPEWANSLLAFFLILGFPIVLVFAWAFELTPDGFRPESSGSPTEAAAAGKGRSLDIAVIVLLLVAAGYFFWESRFSDRPVETVTDSAEQPGTVDEAAVASGPRGGKIAVLPFANVSEDESRDYFSDGVTEEVINALVSVPGISVPARTTIFGFKDYAGDIREIGRTLGVAYVLEGSVRSVGNEARITASLVDMDSGLPVWSETFERNLDKIFAVQDEIARAIAAELEVELGVNEAVPNQTSDMAAYDAYLRGRAALRKRDRDAIGFLEQATQSAEGFAPAWATLAIAHQSLTGDHGKAIEAARRALAIDATNIDAMTAMGSVLRQTRRWTESEAYFKRALSIDPGSAELLEDYAEFLNLVGRNHEALEVAERGMEIDPRIQPLVAAYAEALTSVGRDIEARQVVADSLRAYGDQSGLWWASLPLWLLSDGVPTLDQPGPVRAGAGFEYLRSSLASADAQTINDLKSILSSAPGRLEEIPITRREARLLLLYFDEVDFVIEQDIADPSFFPSGAREWLWSPAFQDYRAHPRFGDFLERVRITNYWDATALPPTCRKRPDNTVRCQ